MARMGEEEGLAVADLDPELVSGTREVRRMHADRVSDRGAGAGVAGSAPLPECAETARPGAESMRLVTIRQGRKAGRRPQPTADLSA